MTSDNDVETCCPKYQRAAEVLGKRWTPQIIRMLLSGHQHFSELRTAIPGISDRLLSERMYPITIEGLEGAMKELVRKA